jgi:Fe-S-cluster-containing dehydrogenase component/anaerobic selenocysteine-containing dehydrogenase
MDRRTFLRWMAGAGASGAGLGFMRHRRPAQTQNAAQQAAESSEIGQKLPDRWISSPKEQPYVRPGLWTIFATTCRECPAGCGMHVRVREGRVIKCEGNPDHSVSRGGLCPRGQSAPQGLYDPDRVRRPLRRVGKTQRRTEDPGLRSPNLIPPPPVPAGFEALPWTAALSEVAEALKTARRLLVVSDLQTGTLAEILQLFHQAVGLPGAVAFYEAFDYEPLRTANQKLFGQAALPRYRLQECDFLLSFGAEFLETWISNVEFAWQFAQMHHHGPDWDPKREGWRLGTQYRGEMVSVGPTLSMTAANADHFIQIPAGQEYRTAAAILQEVTRLRGTPTPPGTTGSNPQLQEVARRFAGAQNAVALGGPVGAVGPAAENLATAVMSLNRAVGAVGRTVDFSQTHALSRTTPAPQLAQMLADLSSDDVLIVHQTNPVYTLPHLAAHLGRVGHLVYVGTMLNETARMAQWVLPVHSPLEAWGDYEPWTGIHCLMQPAMGALHDTRHSGDVFLALAEQYGRPLAKAGERLASFHDWLRLNWRQLGAPAGTEFETFWQQSLQRGGVFEEPTRPKAQAEAKAPVRSAAQAEITVRPVSSAERASPEALQLWLWPSIKLFDGRLANRGWMQEVPERMSTLTWGSWVDLSPATARRLQIAAGDAVEVATGAGRVTAPARITNEVADNVVALAFGQGHTGLGETADGRGANAFLLRTRPAGDSLFGTVQLRKTGAQVPLIDLSVTQDQHGRGIVRWTTPEELRTMTKKDIEEIIWPGPRGYDAHRDLYTPHYYPEHRWAMVIDLDRCIGCGACTVACYAENNIPVMGPGPLLRNREMTWLRVPPYRHPEEPRRVGFLVLPCQHCDAAPCEPVCPVFAAVHNDQGLNAQIYNRCIGTRFCNNNCPYKVRRFNWFDPVWREPLHIQLNPDVTARCRGVMEKCTFCIQRIHYHERQAKVEGRPLRDGEVQPACVQSCPTRAFVFGDLMQEGSEVSRFFEHPRRYQLLKELNTKPAVIYLKRIKPQKPEII